jgi:choline dehydrogenase-like flavoprotein
VVARRLAENPDVSVLLLEAGGTDDVPNVIIGERAGEMLKADHKL